MNPLARTSAFIIILIALTLIVTSDISRAETEGERQETGGYETTEQRQEARRGIATEDEKAGFSFFRLHNSEPDYAFWVQGTERFKSTAFSQRNKILEEEVERLKTLFEAYDLEKDLIAVDTEIRLSIKENRNGDYALSFRFTEIPNENFRFIPKTFGSENLALVLKNDNMLSTIRFSPETYRKDIRKYWFEDVNYTARLRLNLRPVSADNSKPMELSGENRWLVMAQIKDAQIDFHDRFQRQDVTLWSYSTETQESDASAQKTTDMTEKSSQ